MRFIALTLLIVGVWACTDTIQPTEKLPDAVQFSFKYLIIQTPGKQIDSILVQLTEFNKNNQVIRDTNYSEAGYITSISSTNYIDGEHAVETVIKYDKDQKATEESYNYNFDDNGRLIQRTHINSDDDTLMISTFKYNDGSNDFVQINFDKSLNKIDTFLITIKQSKFNEITKTVTSNSIAGSQNLDPLDHKDSKPNSDDLTNEDLNNNSSSIIYTIDPYTHRVSEERVVESGITKIYHYHYLSFTN